MRDSFDWGEIEALTGPSIPRGQPPGTFTIDEYAARFGLTASGAQDRLQIAAKNGKLERIKFLTPAGRHAFAYKAKCNDKGRTRKT